ncbi:hypothetical protein CPLU01_06816 [Colletotrichum plurivorum]|uniref:DUF1308 domain-containing protein n=1 Tax=Colletotrichum plurivorum TaxID=2175906 RepID=A0A8H6KH72_9PEZI|nr:hypothetical protein CPLU01_06816 [Colletotrichum plurivorum]
MSELLIDVLRNTEELVGRAAVQCRELETLRIAIEKESAKINNQWHAHIPGFSTFLQLNIHQSARAEALLQRIKAEDFTEPEGEGILHRDYRLIEGEVASFENNWAAIKKCHSITGFRHAIPLRTQAGGKGQSSVFVTAIVENGHEWVRVLSTTEKALLVQMAEVDFPCNNNNNNSDDDNSNEKEDDPELQKVLKDDDTQIELLKCAQQLLAAARRIHGGYQHRIRIILPNIQSGQKRKRDIDRLLRGVQSLSDSDIPLVVECAQEARQPPPALDVAIKNLLDLGRAAEAPPLTPVINVDTSILVALTTDICHKRAAQQKWRPKVLDDVADEAEHGPRLTKCLHPLLGGRTLVCTRQAADTCVRMVYDAATDAEIARLEILLGQETLRGKEDDKMAFIERVLDQDHWPAGAEDDPKTESRRQRLVAELQKLSCHPVPEDLQLPIRIAEDFRREHVRGEVLKGNLPKVALEVEPTLNDTNCSSFIYGWRTGNTTITCNRHVVRKMGSLVNKLRWSRDAEMAPIIALDWSRGLAKLPFPGEVLVKWTDDSAA